MSARTDRCCLLRWLCAALLATWLLPGPAAVSQEVVVEGQPMSREQAEAMMRAKMEAEAKARGEKGEDSDKKKEEGEKKKEGDEKDKDKKKEEETPSVKRPDKPPRVPDPRELQVSLDERGRVPPFAFIGQPWPDVLQWLANVSKCSLDWQELPADYLNLTTQRIYPLDEVRDLVNRQLHARGYTMLLGGEVLSVFKIEKLDPSLVPRATEDDLYDRKPYDFVKVSFELPEKMAPDKAAEDVKKVLSPNAKVFPLVSAKRILVIDAVANQRLVSALLNEERMAEAGRIVPREFVLKYARAEKVIDILYVVLGLDPKSRPTQMDLQLQQQRLQLMMQMQQKGTDVSKMLKQEGPPVFLAYNRQRNSVLANAPPEYMRIIEQAIQYLDVPFGGASDAEQVGSASTERAGPSSAPAGDERTTKRYPLTTLDPQNFVLTLEEIGGLDPRTDLKVDTKSRTLFALATDADHEKIARLIDQFDGEGRRFAVIQLRRLPADLAAVSIRELMIGEEKKEENNEMPWYYGRRRGQQEEKDPNPHEGFRVVADVENNRLMLRANEAEMTEVRSLLAELGEIPAEGKDTRPVRFIQPGSDAARDRLLEQLRRLWPAMGENQLIIDAPEKAEPAESDREKPKADDSHDGQPTDRSASSAWRSRPWVHLAQFQVAAAERADAEPSQQPAEQSAGRETAPPPVTITVTPDGRLILASPDTVALDRLEELIDQLSPPEQRFKVFRLRYVSAYGMYWLLKDYFADDLAGKEKKTAWDPWWWGPVETGGQDDITGLARRRKLMITYDTPSRTILVANASPSQLHEVEQLIREYDRPAPEDSIKSRRTATIKIRYSKASVIAAALKDVYRDLLSSRDKEFQSGEKKEQRPSEERVVIRYGDSSTDGDKRAAPVEVGFEGALSVGVDDISNTLIVSVQEELFEDVVKMVQHLDEEAAPKTTVYVHQVTRSVDPASLQKALSEALGTPWPGGRPEKQPAAAPATSEKKTPKETKPGSEGSNNSE
jgi:type II secretory pathway component GspD/PulD (secretin)